jgi:hypothetical protein
MNEITQVSGYRIETTRVVACIDCIVAADDDFGVTINQDDKMILNYLVTIVEGVDCEEDGHDDTITEGALKKLVEQGKVEVVIVDGVTKYRAVKR